MTPDEPDAVFNLDEIDDVTFAAIAKKRFNEADAYYSKKDTSNRKLKSIRADNRKQYLSGYTQDVLIDDRYEEVYNDNRQFIAIRTMVPFVTGQITAPEVTPANKDDLSKYFANDFEKVLEKHLEAQNGKYKTRLSVQDVLIGERVGIGKWRYDGDKQTVVVDHISPGAITIGRRANLFEEPDIREELERTPGDLIRQFPDQKDKILELFAVADTPDALDEKTYFIYEDWIWLEIDGEKTLCLGWSYKDYVFGKIKDPNWNESGDNIIDSPMVPYFFFNLINDGSGYIDQTSYTEQTKYSQSNYNKRGQVIAESAKYGGTGVPIFAKGAITQADAAKVHFSPIQRVLLDTADVTKAFTTWQQANMPAFYFEDKADLKASIDDGYGINSISRGQTSDNKTATQDVLLRNQAEGRMVDVLDMIEIAQTRSYQLEAQLMYRYFTNTQYYNYIGDDGDFVSIAINSKDIAKNIGLKISVKAGTSLPVDRSQKRATLLELAKADKVPTLALYEELDLFDDPERAYKQYLEEKIALGTGDPSAVLADVNDDLFDREALQDLVSAIGGKKPKEREDITPEYVNFLNEWLLTDKYKMLTLTQQQRVSDFVDEVRAKAQRKADKLALQPNPAPLPGAPMPPGLPAPGGPPGTPPGAPSAVPPAVAAPSQPPGGAPSLAGALPSAAPALQ